MAIKTKFRDPSKEDMVAVGATDAVFKDGWLIIGTKEGGVAAMYPEDVVFGVEKVKDIPVDTFTCI